MAGLKPRKITPLVPNNYDPMKYFSDLLDASSVCNFTTHFIALSLYLQYIQGSTAELNPILFSKLQSSSSATLQDISMPSSEIDDTGVASNLQQSQADDTTSSKSQPKSNIRTSKEKNRLAKSPSGYTRRKIYSQKLTYY